MTKCKWAMRLSVSLFATQQTHFHRAYFARRFDVGLSVKTYGGNMKIKKTTRRIARGWTAGFAALMAVSLGASSLIKSNQSYLDSYLGHSRYTFIADSKPDNPLDLYNHTVDAARAHKTGATAEDNAKGKFDLATAKGVVEYSRWLSEKIAGDGQVLMKNDAKALPLNKASEKITLLGARSYLNAFSGSMGSVTNVSEATTLYKALKDQGFELELDTRPNYEAAYFDSVAKSMEGGVLSAEDRAAIGEFDSPNAGGTQDSCGSGFGAIVSTTLKGYSTWEPTTTDLGLTNKESKSGVAIVTVGRRSQEAGYYLPGEAGKTTSKGGKQTGFGGSVSYGPTRDAEWEEGDDCLALNKQERAMIKFAKANYSKVVILVNSDCAMDIDEIFTPGSEYEANAVLWTGLPGAYGFKATAKILDGTINPSGSLVDTYEAKSSISATGQNVGYFSWKDSDETDALKKNSEKSLWYECETEGIFSGYKYDESRYFDLIANPSSNANSKKGAFNGTAWNYHQDVARTFGYGLSYSSFKEEIVDFKVDEGKQTVSATVKVTNTGDVAGKHNVQLYVSVPNSTKVQKSAIQLIDFGKTDIVEPGKDATIELNDISFEKFASWDSELSHDNVKGGYILDEGDYYFTTGNSEGAHGAVNNVLLEMGKTSLYDADNKTVSEKVGTVKKVALDAVKITKSVKGVTLQNQLSDMDPAKQWNLTMLSRSDWDGTFPKPNTNLVPTDSMKPGLECKVYTLTENNNGGKSVVWNAKNGLTLLDMKPAKGETVEYDDPRLLALVQNLSLDEALRNLQCAGGSTFLACKSIGMEITAYQNDGPMGFDGNNGDEKTCLSGDRNPNNTVYDTNDDDATGVNSTALWGNIAMRPLPTNVVVGSTFDKDLVEEAGECIGVIGAWVGNMAIWGPGSNIHRTPYNTRNHEYYSEDPIVLGVMSDVFSKGGKAIGLVMCPKHYAFNDYDLNRSGIAPFLSEQDARENALRGFQYAFESGNAMGSMGAFGRAGATFCSANKGLMTGILRSEWAWNGMFVTDMVNPGYFMNARDSIAAGTDGMLTGASQAANGWFKWNKIEGDEDENNLKGEIERSEVEKDLNFQQCLQDSMHRYFYAILNSNYTNGLQSGKTIEHKAWYNKTATACIAATSTLAGLGALAYVGLSLLGKKED